jgi:hypothetical protein
MQAYRFTVEDTVSTGADNVTPGGRPASRTPAVPVRFRSPPNDLTDCRARPVHGRSAHSQGRTRHNDLHTARSDVYNVFLTRRVP